MPERGRLTLSPSPSIGRRGRGVRAGALGPRGMRNLVNSRENVREGEQYLFVSEAQDRVAVLDKSGGARFVVIRLRVVDRPIDLNHQPARKAAEVEDETADGVLPAEAMATDLAVADCPPQHGLGRRLLSAQTPCGYRDVARYSTNPVRCAFARAHRLAVSRT